MKGIKHVRHKVDFLSRKRKHMLFFVNKDLLSKIYCLLRLSEFYSAFRHVWFTMHSVFDVPFNLPVK